MDDLEFIPVEREINLMAGKAMVYKLTPEGIIDYVNDYFVEISGYEVHEIVGKNLETLKNKDLPTIIYNLILEHIATNKNLNIILKGQAKDGRTYWYITNLESKKDKNGDLTATIISRTAAPREVIPEMEKFYQKLLKIEQHSSLDIAMTYFDGFIEEVGMSFNDYTTSLIKSYNTPQALSSSQSQQFAQPEKKKSLMGKLFGN